MKYDLQPFLTGHPYCIMEQTCLFKTSTVYGKLMGGAYCILFSYLSKPLQHLAYPTGPFCHRNMKVKFSLIFFLQFWFNYNVSSHWQIYPNTLKEYYESQVKVLADDRVYLQRRLAWTVTQNQIFFVRKTNPEQNGPCQRIVFLFSLKRLWEFCS